MAGPGAVSSRLALALAALAALAAVKYYRDAEAARQQELALKSLGSEGLFLFSSLDTNNDLYLSPEEFKPIAEKLTGVTPVSEFEEEETPDPTGETLSIVAKFQPLVMETMTKSKDGFLGISHVALSGLRNWTAPAAHKSVMLAKHFKAFLPPKNKVDLGDPWWIIPSELNIFTGYLSNNRFYPPPPKGKEITIHRLLSMFHPRPFVKTRFAPQGSVACIQAISTFYYAIAFRIHAEFQLNEPPDFPFWFSPGQFTGHIILSKDSSHVREFKLFVPNNRSLNVDMEWLYGASESSNMEVDIGYLPQMELESTGPSVPSVIYDENGNVIDSRDPSGEPIQFVFEEITWQQEIPWEEAAQKLEVAMYPFKKTNRENEFYSKLADLHLEKYNFPVEMIICLPNGTVIHHINANYFLDITSMKPEDVESSIFSFSNNFDDPSTATYLQFLKEGLQRAKSYLQT
uniref:Selenoprotein N n=1 Tax=Anas zonorhyncha TaxID=75864 RepID=A0A8B9ZYI1_9AVES